MSQEDRSIILGLIVKALVKKWDILADLNGIKAIVQGLRHPARDVLVLTKIAGETDETLLKIALLFWEQLPIEENRLLLMQSFGSNSPIDVDELQILFHQDLGLYGRTVISILLDRGLVEQANFLFCIRMSELYAEVDPGSLDWLVAKGLPVTTATKWLEQSINRKNADAGNKVAIEHCNSAIARWSRISPTKTDSS
jgi:hypothetical protein